MNEREEEREDEEREEPVNMLYFPKLSLGPSIPNYYGDYVRRLFIGAAVAMLVLLPFLMRYMPLTLPFEIVGIVVLIVLAALTNPKKEWIMIVNSVVAGLGVAVSETLALLAYLDGETFIFFARESLAFIFIFALYFSLKTARAMESGRVGRRDPPGEFREPTLEEMWNETRGSK